MNQKYKDELKNLTTQYINKTVSNIDVYMQSFNYLTIINKNINNNYTNKNNLQYPRRSEVTFAKESSNTVKKYSDTSNRSNKNLKKKIM